MHRISVTLYVRVWIETVKSATSWRRHRVTLYVRVWIETKTWERAKIVQRVTLYVRVWIETTRAVIHHPERGSHPLREGVD